jgi:hypothetical protein
VRIYPPALPRTSGRTEHEGEPVLATLTGLQLELALARQYFEAIRNWLTARTDEPAEWREAAQFGDSPLHLTAPELTGLAEQIDALLQPFRGREPGACRGRQGARPVLMLHVAVPAAAALPVPYNEQGPS